ncbi:hypothetical protein J6590_076027 [Homalodisca vitripennis]|nr:hypothetical protein J6590_076027 [Homalodisca vitripennis]
MCGKQNLNTNPMASQNSCTEDTTDRMMQPLSAVASGNYTISFMPLLSVLINMFPRIMSRVRLQPLTATTHARKLEALWDWERTSLCSILETEGWAQQHDPCVFYSCSFGGSDLCDSQMQGPERQHSDTILLTSTSLDECTTVEVRRCSDPSHKYDPAVASCVPANLLCQHKDNYWFTPKLPSS